MEQFDKDFLKRGLTHLEAKERQRLTGKNAITGKKRLSALARFMLQFGDVMVLILIAAASISIVLGIVEQSFSEIIDGFVIFVIVWFNALFGFLQENKAIASIESLQKLTASISTVRREGEVIRIKSEDLVVGDVVLLEAGATLAADIILTETHSLMIDESSITGESVPAQKNHKKISSDLVAMADRQDQAYSGTHVTYGRGEGVVIACGNNTHIGKIAALVQSEVDEKTPLEKNIAAVGKIITFVVLGVAALIFVAEMLLSDARLVDAFMTAVAISVAAIPESLPAVITIIMALGVTRLAKKKAIVKKLHAVETLGSCNVICSDKTGTLTQNIMTVQKLFANGTELGSDCQTQEVQELLMAMVLCNDAEQSKHDFIGDPTEIALLKYAQQHKIIKTELESTCARISELPFDSHRKLMTTLNDCTGKKVQFTKGGVDEVLKRCTHILINGKKKPITNEHILQIRAANKMFASEALRVLAYAMKKVTAAVFEPTETDLVFVGLTGMIDPPRKEVKQAVAKCNAAGMRAIMITGDHKLTAFAIAKEIGIAEHEDQVITGEELDKLSYEQLLLKLPALAVFARVSPNHKMQIIKALKSMGKVVAMTGDGVNDAPAIKAADIGVGMGITGTDITKEAADIIIADDNFATIVVAVEEGRKIYKNIQKTIRFLFTTNFAEIMSLFIASVVFPKYVFLLPLQILFVNLVTDSLPAIALGVELPEKSLMKESPREVGKHIFAGGVGTNIIVQGMFQTIILIAVYTIGLLNSVPPVATTMVFYALNLMQMLHLFSVRTASSVFASNPFKNKMVIASSAVIVGSILLLNFTALGQLLKLTRLTSFQWYVVLIGSFSLVLFNEIYRIIQNAWQHKKQKAKRQQLA